MAVSTAAVDESTFIWNPNLIALSSSIALAGAWRAWIVTRSALVGPGGRRGGRHDAVPRPWRDPPAGRGALFIADLRRRGPGPERRSVARAGPSASWSCIVAYVPLLVHELTTGFAEVRAALDYLGGGRDAGAAALPIRFGIVGLRVVSWPLVGLITAGFVAAVVAAALVIAIVVWRWRAPSTPRRERVAVRWLGLGLLWTVAALTVAAPSLASVVPGLPNDHYHAFADPMVFVLVGLGVAAMARTVGDPADRAGRARRSRSPRRASSRSSPGTSPTSRRRSIPTAGSSRDGRRRPGDRGIAHGGRRGGRGRRASITARLQVTEAMAYPLIRAGQAVIARTPQGVSPGSADPVSVAAAGPSALVLLCDDLFRGGDRGSLRRAGRGHDHADHADATGGRCWTGSRRIPAAGSRSTGLPPGCSRGPRCRNGERRRPRRRRSLSPRPGWWRAIRVVPWKVSSSGRAPGLWSA